jgi:hypothetical protein
MDEHLVDSRPANAAEREQIVQAWSSGQRAVFTEDVALQCNRFWCSNLANETGTALMLKCKRVFNCNSVYNATSCAR